ncbi:MAG: divergent PAP2 family protein [Firmicutes bacterium]|nr:divergent PAP2 family protein [Bacillota bacterium]
MNFFQDLISNRTVIAVFVAWLAAQVIKTLLYFVRNRSFDLERLYGAGGMPSSHSSMVMALTASIAKYCGAGSPQFAIALCFALIVIYDAMGVRRQAGEHAKMLNLITSLFQMQPGNEEIKAKFNELKELLGHTPLEVASGTALGILIGVLV